MELMCEFSTSFGKKVRLPPKDRWKRGIYTVKGELLCSVKAKSFLGGGSSGRRLVVVTQGRMLIYHSDTDGYAINLAKPNTVSVETSFRRENKLSKSTSIIEVKTNFGSMRLAPEGGDIMAWVTAIFESNIDSPCQPAQPGDSRISVGANSIISWADLRRNNQYRRGVGASCSRTPSTTSVYEGWQDNVSLREYPLDGGSSRNSSRRSFVRRANERPPMPSFKE